MALASISLNNGATVIGRAARPQRRGHAEQQRARQLPLQHGIDAGWRHHARWRHRRRRHGHGHGAGAARRARRTAARAARLASAGATRRPTRVRRRRATARRRFRRTPHATCTSGFRAEVKGKLIKRVTFRLDGKQHREPVRSGPFGVFVRALARRAQRDGARDVQGRHPRQEPGARLPRLRRSRALAPRPARRSSPDEAAGPHPPRRRAARDRRLAGLAARRRPRPPQRGRDPAARDPAAGSRRPRLGRARTARVVEPVAALRPLTQVRTVLPVMGARQGQGRQPLGARPPARAAERPHRLDPRRPDDPLVHRVAPRRHGLDAARSRSSATASSCAPSRRSCRRPPTPTPYGQFFVEEALAISPHDVGGPYALAISARSDIFQEFEGGPGQIAIHGTDGLSDPLGSAASHGCIRLSPSAITWLAKPHRRRRARHRRALEADRSAYPPARWNETCARRRCTRRSRRSSGGSSSPGSGG